MNRSWAAELVCVTLALAIYATPQTPGDQQLEEMWRSGHYSEALPLLVDEWKSPGGRTWRVEYMIGTSECQMPGLANNGVLMLKDVQAFRLPKEIRTAVQSQVDACQGSVKSSPGLHLPSGTQILFQFSPGATVAGKGGYLFEEENRPSVVTTPVSVDELRSRLVPIGHQKQTASDLRDIAEDHALMRVDSPSPYGKAAIGDFIVVTAIPVNSVASNIGTCLTDYQHALQETFGMQAPDDYITVYAFPFVGSVADYAPRLHGINLPLGTVAYSVYEDLSIVGIGGEESCGTLAHELVHLMIKERFGNSPAWLEEGLASEVAVGYPPIDGKLQFRRSWRDDMLKTHWQKRPTVRELLKTSWDDFSALNPGDLERVATVNAMAASFVRYLDSRGKLLNVYSAFRDQRISADVQHFRSDEDVLAQVMGEPLDKLDAEFVTWFTAQAKSQVKTQVKTRDSVPKK